MLVRTGTRRRIVRLGEGVIPQTPFDPACRAERCPDPARNNEEVYVLYVRGAASGVGTRPAADLVCPQRVHIGLSGSVSRLAAWPTNMKCRSVSTFIPRYPASGWSLPF